VGRAASASGGQEFADAARAAINACGRLLLEKN